MKVNKANNIAMFDVDKTLILTTDKPKDLPVVTISTHLGAELFYEMTNMTAQIKRHHMQGHHVIVWSKGGHEWAETVVKALGLTEYVDQVMSKPHWYMDDQDANEWMKRTIP